MKIITALILQILKIGILSCLFFPIFWGLSVGYDWLFSNSGYLLEIIHGSKDHYVRVLSQDWINAIPLSVFVAIIIATPIQQFINRVYNITPVAVFVARYILIFITAFWIYKTFIPGVTFFVLSALLLSLSSQSIHLVSQRFLGKP